MVENFFVLVSEHVGKGEKSISTEWGGDKFKCGESPIPLIPPPPQRISVLFFFFLCIISLQLNFTLKVVYAMWFIFW